MPPFIEAILFDFGGVFTTSPFTAVEDAGRSLGAEPGHLQEIVFGSYQHDTDHPWHRLERGELGLLDARSEIIEIAREQGFEIDPFQILADAMGDRGVRESMVECVRTVRGRGYRTAMVTNNVREFSQGWRKLLPVDELFELVIDSSVVGVRKPDPEIYRLTLRELGGIAPERSIFVDDFESNVHAARELGMRAVLVPEDYERAISELVAMLDA